MAVKLLFNVEGTAPKPAQPGTQGNPSSHTLPTQAPGASGMWRLPLFPSPAPLSQLSGNTSGGMPHPPPSALQV